MNLGGSEAGCESLAERLAELASAGGDPGSDAEVAAHLIGCVRCREELEAMIRAREALARPDSLTVPAGLAERTAMRALQALRAAGTRPAERAEKSARATAGAAGCPGEKRKRRILAALFRPIEHPAARAAAAAGILLLLAPLASVDIAEKIGAWQCRIMGERLVARIEPIGEKILDWYAGLVEIHPDGSDRDDRDASPPREGSASAATRAEV
ncbi:MAG: hypothetical protein N3A38_00305 [Planctomycetota bacterium]|nr:hypothetical protein [Planctomycetota bacterium]